MDIIIAFYCSLKWLFGTLSACWINLCDMMSELLSENVCVNKLIGKSLVVNVLVERSVFKEIQILFGHPNMKRSFHSRKK